MNKPILYIFLLIFASLFLNAQEKPCIEYERPKNDFTIRDSIISPIFPGCESFKESNDSLNRCFGKQIAKRIADKLDMEIYPILKDIDSTNLFETRVIIDIKQTGKLEMKLKERVYSEFENHLVEKINEISEETTGIIPAKFENNYCSPYRYTLPIKFDLTEWNEN